MYFFNALYDHVLWFRGRVYGAVVERLVMFMIDKIKLKVLAQWFKWQNCTFFFFLWIKDNFYFTNCDIFMVLFCRFFGKVSVLEAHAALFLKNPHDIENLEVLVTKLGEGKIPVWIFHYSHISLLPRKKRENEPTLNYNMFSYNNVDILNLHLNVV